MDSARVMAVASAMRGAAAGMRIDDVTHVWAVVGECRERRRGKIGQGIDQGGGGVYLSLVIGQRGTPDPIVFFSRCSVVLMCLPRRSPQQHSASQ